METIQRAWQHGRKQKNNLLAFLMLIFVAILLVLSIVLVRAKLLQNTDDLGMALAESYAVEEKMNLTSMNRVVDLAYTYVLEILEEEPDPAKRETRLQTWLAEYALNMSDIWNDNVFDIYVVVDGRIVAANPWEGDDEYDYAATDWYQGALEAGGQRYDSPIYEDAVTGQQIMTVSVALPNPGDVLAVDIYVQKAMLHQVVRQIPDQFSYYLCDGHGQLLYASSPWSEEKSLNQANYLMEGILDGSLTGYDASFVDYDGVRRGIYYSEMSNGWMVIMTIPLDAIFYGEQNLTVYLVGGVAGLIFLLLLGLTIRDTLQNYRMRRVDEVVHMLGDSFYAIYRVNFRKESYEAIKSHPDTWGSLAPRGSYKDLLSYVQDHVKPTTYQKFEESFSLEEIRRRVLQGVKDYGGDYQRRFGEEYRWVNIRTLYDAGVDPDEVTLCFQDVDAERRQQMQHMILLQDALESSRKSARAKSDFFSNMSHDMRTPLNAIIGFCGLAQKSQEAGDQEKVRDYIRKIDFAGNQLLTLINDILELSRLEAGKASLQQTEFDLGQMVENTAEIFREQARAQDKTFELHLDVQDTHVVGDNKKISQILNNLLSNSLKYSNAGARIQLDVRQFRFQQHSKFQFVVEDTGIGMSESFMEHLFEPYARETTFSAQSTVGTGLGMPIVKSLVQQMSGEISVESTLGQGTKFTVTIPLKTLEQPEAPAPAPEQAEEEPFDWNGRKVLLAEDNELNREIATEVLTMCGAQVIPAVNGQEALRIFSESALYSFDAVLMDMQMPVMDGCEAARSIRALKRPDALWVPIVAVTANAFAEDISRTTQAGMDDHVSKPIDFNLLSQVLQKVLQERKKGSKKEKE